ncbi:MAG: TlpA disulfide reductase family protein [Bacteroidota bacterium]
MKTTKFLLLIVLLTVSFTAIYSQNVSWNETVKAGEKIKVTYETDKDVKDANVYVYFATDENLPLAKEAKLKMNGDKMMAKLEVPENATAMLLCIKDGEGKVIDNNETKGYFAKVADKEGNKQTASYYGKASLMSSWGRRMEVEADFEKAISLVKKGLEAEGDAADMDQYSTLQMLITRGKTESGKEVLAAYAEKMTKKKKKTDEEFAFVHGYHANFLKDKEAAAAIEKKAMKKYPNGKVAVSKVRGEFFGSRGKEVEEVKVAYNNYMAILEATDDKDAMSYPNYMMVTTLGSDKLEEAMQYADKIEDPMFKAMSYRTLAIPLAGKEVGVEGTDVKKALELTEVMVAELQKYGERDKPSYMTDEEWKDQAGSMLKYYGDTHAMALFNAGKKEEGLTYQLNLCEESEYSDPNKNEVLVQMFKEVRPAAETEKLIADLILKNQSTQKMVDTYREIFIANNTIEQAFDKQLAMLEKEANKEFRKELMEKMIDEEAPGFDLVDINGNKVNLADLKGKIKVLDFWATWCGPCKASFPGMQKAQEKFANRDDVVFLFINSWENGDTFDDKKKAASDFMTEKEYPFTVLMDGEDKVITSYKVEGIPTKFIIDKDNRIRFKSVGYMGSDDKLVKELKMMIDLADSGSTTTASLDD